MFSNYYDLLCIMEAQDREGLCRWLENFAYWVDSGCYIDKELIEKYLNAQIVEKEGEKL